MKENLSFEILAKSISGVNYRAGNAAKGAVNQLMTMRNWAIGYFIVEYEQSGKDRAEYGSDLLNNLERQINERGMNSILLKCCRLFLTYVSADQCDSVARICYRRRKNSK